MLKTRLMSCGVENGKFHTFRDREAALESEAARHRKVDRNSEYVGKYETTQEQPLK